MSAITGGPGSAAMAQVIAREEAAIERIKAEAQRAKIAADAAAGVEVRETYRNGRYEIERVTLPAFDRVSQSFKDAVARAKADEQQARIALGKAQQQARLYNEYNGLHGKVAEDEYTKTVAPAAAELDRATARRERAEQALGEQVRAYTDLERVEAEIADEEAADQAWLAEQRAKRHVRLTDARLRCAD